MTVDTSVSFEIQGRFAGFFRDFFGKRRMVLRVGNEEIYLKVPKVLRKELDGVLSSNQEVVAIGREGAEGPKSRVVVQVRTIGNERCIACPILVCTKKNCWRNGGKELWAALEQKIAEAGLSETVKLQGVDCLDRCKHAPNVDCGGREYERCSTADAAEILADFTGEDPREIPSFRNSQGVIP